KDGWAIPGATADRLFFNRVGEVEAGVYHVAVSNRAGTTLSSTVRLELWPDLLPPQGSAAAALIFSDDGIRLSGQLNGLFSPDTSFQWYRDGEPIPGADSRWLSIPGATLEHAGEY